ncbi:alpha/beta fold hydrolase [Kitasatospora sp. GP82]|uniref:thioesterase II family protein n=1 Tax=Kitasatospora sp. GP82 TaxID=3035089 RepID=UPI002476B342|nr:alpha/beta fold hydrolase [Kitasatospora sp. GP82]MDH6128358.1 surfactin synthase thioesterase subunit [Kitasatospora sp. GP82]
MPNYRWLVEISGSAAAEHVLYAFPHAGAGAAAVKKLCRALGDSCQTVAVRLPGRESRMDEEPITDLARLCDRLAEQITAHAGQRRIVLYGHCGGGVIAYETARRLPARTLRHLVVSAQQAPDRIPPVESWRLPEDEFLAQVARDGYLPREILDQPELRELVLPALRADYQAIECHVSAMDALGAPVLALAGTQDRSVAVDDVVAWSRLTTAGFRLELIPGGHNLLLDRSAEVAEAVRPVFS